MYLKKLEISGFKSFASKTMLDFCDNESGEIRGVTAIVGPNGSGKSNIADAVRWAIGEQSMKNLRGKKSEDIIFAGSGKKSRLGGAHVTLFFDNSDKKLPLEFSEVSITRKIFRSGESEYRINGSRVRLQDIVDLLASAGIGKESYTIVNQGMADAVLNASPLERRSIIEEAAGVKQYQIKKERAIRKVDSTRENLARVKSLVEEIAPHLKMLKRQAEKAAQSEEIARELKDKQTKLFTYLWNNFQEERDKFNEEKNDLGRQMMNIQREVDKLTDEISQEAKESGSNLKLENLEKSLREKKNRLNQMDRDLIVTEGRIEIEKEKQKNLQVIQEIAIESIPVNLGYVKEALDEIRKDQEALIYRLENVENLEQLQEIREFARVIQQRLHDLKQDVEKGKKEKVSEKKEQEMEVKRKEMEERKSFQLKSMTDLEEKTSSLRAGIKKAEEEVRKIETEIAEEIRLDREKRQRFFEIERRLRIKQDELNRFKDEYNDSKIALAKVEVREEDLRKEVRDELRIDVAELGDSREKIERESFEREIIKLKIKMEQVGGIDPMIQEEYQETNKRHEFLVNESQDLEKAIASLKDIIKEMDQKIGKVFADTFEEINKEFIKYFKVIFGGGQAHLNKIKVQKSHAYRQAGKFKIKEEDLSDEEKDEADDEAGNVGEEGPEEIGIEIFANPPGKKITNLSMLSGGERSLTSLALLFAIISHNPPPFSILDEVEAALDEANSKRFGRIIADLSQNTQFVIITHNRETMRQASLLYGVTMSEDGISKLLSVRLDQVGQGGKIIKA